VAMNKLSIWFKLVFLPMFKNEDFSEFDRKARKFAFRSHSSTNHKYDGLPYKVHLRLVLEFAKKYIHLIPEDKKAIVLASCWAHDGIEDCRLTYNDVKEVLGIEVTDIVYALTNDKGKNRKQRAGENYYKGIRETEFATFVKLCDRFANLHYSTMKGSRMSDMYKREMSHFIKSIYDSKYDVMFEDLKMLVC
jgi:(p)ppGpp synthase/HD superfamily hydrolase